MKISKRRKTGLIWFAIGIASACGFMMSVHKRAYDHIEEEASQETEEIKPEKQSIIKKVISMIGIVFFSALMTFALLSTGECMALERVEKDLKE